jgi:hypothetical protein
MSYFEEDTMRYGDTLNKEVHSNPESHVATGGLVLGPVNETFRTV